MKNSQLFVACMFVVCVGNINMLSACCSRPRAVAPGRECTAVVPKVVQELKMVHKTWESGNIHEVTENLAYMKALKNLLDKEHGPGENHGPGNAFTSVGQTYYSWTVKGQREFLLFTAFRSISTELK